MTSVVPQTAPPVAPAVAPPVAPFVPAAPSSRQLAFGYLRSMVAGTPGRLRVYGALAIVSCLVFGAFAFVAATTKASALADARSNAAQLLRVQAVRIQLVTADASLTNAFLVGGLEPASARAAYENAIAEASQLLAQASGGNATDAAALAAVNDTLSTYVGLVESARANNRQGYPIGAAYLRQATTLLRTDALPALEKIGTDEQKRIDDAYDASARAAYWLIVGLVLALIGLVVAQFWVTQRTKRVFNLPLVTATGIVLVAGLVLGGTMLWSQSKAKDSRSGAYFSALELGAARVDAFDAKSAESLTLIARGSGSAYELRYAALAADTVAILTDAADRGVPLASSTLSDFQAYDSLHKTIRADDNGGDWDKAVSLATGSGSTDSNALFAQFDSTSGQALAQQASDLRDQLHSARLPLVPLAWIALVAGIAAAVASGRGVSTRLREYR